MRKTGGAWVGRSGIGSADLVLGLPAAPLPSRAFAHSWPCTPTSRQRDSLGLQEALTARHPTAPLSCPLPQVLTSRTKIMGPW